MALTQPQLLGAQVLHALAAALQSSGKAATITAILKAGGYPLSFSASSAGKLVLGWYYLAKGAHLASVRGPPPVPWTHSELTVSE